MSQKRPCPSCGSTRTVVRNLYRAKSTDGVRRTCICRDCDHSWNAWEGTPPGADYRRKSYPERKPLTEEQVRMILLDRSTGHLEMGKRLDPPKSYSTVRRVRYGSLCAHIAPDVPRWNSEPRLGGLSCPQCRHWRGHCGLDFPDPEEEGLGFAAECDMYKPKTS